MTVSSKGGLREAHQPLHTVTTTSLPKLRAHPKPAHCEPPLPAPGCPPQRLPAPRAFPVLRGMNQSPFLVFCDVPWPPLLHQLLFLHFYILNLPVCLPACGSRQLPEGAPFCHHL